MNFVNVSCGLKQSYSVSEEVFVKLINSTIRDTKFIKLDGEPRISFAKDKSNVSFVIDIKIKSGKVMYDIIDSFRSELINRFISLVDIQPRSVRVCFVGYY